MTPSCNLGDSASVRFGYYELSLFTELIVSHGVGPAVTWAEVLELTVSEHLLSVMSHGTKDKSTECSICLKVESKVRLTRQSKKDNWILCDCCKRWFHASCGGYTASQYSKISRDNIWLKCVVCCTQHILQTDSREDFSTIVSAILEAAKSRIELSSSSKGNKKKKGTESLHNNSQATPLQGNSLLSTSTSKVDSQHSTTCIKDEHICDDVNRGTVTFETQLSHCTSADTGGDLSQSNNVINNSSVFCATSDGDILNRNSSVVTNCVSDIFASPPSQNIQSSDICKEVRNNCFYHKQLVLYNKSACDKILVVDNIDNPVEYSSSKRILKEIRNFFPEVSVEFAYSLAKGGIAIHTKCKEDRDLLLDQLPAEAFGGGVKHPPKGNASKVVYIKGVDTTVDLGVLTTYLGSYGINISDIRRLTKRYTGKPTQVVKVRCSEEAANKLFTIKVVVNHRVCLVEEERSIRIIRCFNCQSLGHTARHCRNYRVCEVCAGTHSEDETCGRHVKCANCGGPHPASSSQCAAFLSRYEALAKQYTEHKHFTATASSDSGKTTTGCNFVARDMAAC